MKALPCNADLLRVAPRVMWFEPPERALAEPIRFLAYVMTYATAEEIAEVLGVAIAVNAGAALVFSARAMDAVMAGEAESP